LLSRRPSIASSAPAPDSSKPFFAMDRFFHFFHSFFSARHAEKQFDFRRFAVRISAFSVLIIVCAPSLFALPDGYKSVKLGMSVDNVKAALKKEGVFGYRGDRDVSLAPGDNEVLIETDGTYAPFSYFERCWFQFSNGKLYIITINLNQEKMDHYSVFKTLTDKYGNPEELTPEKSTWKNSAVIMSLERPLALKYIDAAAFAAKQNSSNVQKTASEQSKTDFLNGL
jgi:hypothetical protein